MCIRLIALIFLCLTTVLAQSGVIERRPAPAPYAAPDLTALVAHSGEGLRDVIARYVADRGTLQRFYDVANSSATDSTFRQFYLAWQEALTRLDFERLAPDARVDYILFRNKLKHELRQLDLAKARVEENSVLVPFAPAIIGLKESRQRVDPLDPAKAAATLVAISNQIEDLTSKISNKPEEWKISKTASSRASRSVSELRETLKQWFQFYEGYDPLFTWWAAEPYKKLDRTLEQYSATVREKLAGVKKDDRDTIIGDPIGREALLADLAYEMIPYTPEELVAIAEKEFAWCEAEMRKASREMGFGDDWRGALEHVKTLHVPPGQQPALILEQALEAIDFVEKRDLITVPPLARDTWRMQMMTPERQRVNPFFTGGEVISVSFPTESMSHEQKMMSMRGNNIHFSRATVHHELIPGHYLQQFMNARYRTYRSAFRTPFWIEGWALYWEMLLWDEGFAKSPENRIGMLFWRSHRAARIIFSLSFHLGKMTAQQCVGFLVDRVGHERENAAGEVRRSFETNYEPLYQAAYLLGGLQFRALHKELVTSGKMTNRQFHDEILKLNQMPVEMVRASLTGQRLSKDFASSWKFYGNVSPAP